MKELIEQNKIWAKEFNSNNEKLVDSLTKEQSPKILWLGCSDSRVPAELITNSLPGDIFVHRNIANQVGEGDVNFLSVLEFAVRVLKVERIIVCGHESCGGVIACLDDLPAGNIKKWLTPLKHNLKMNNISDLDEAVKFNVKSQVESLASNEIIRSAWESGQKLSIHGVVYSFKTSLLTDLEISQNGKD